MKMGIRREWSDNNILDVFDVFRDNYKFSFSTHPQDPEMETSCYFAEEPSISLIMRVKNAGVKYSIALILNAKLSLEEIKQKAKGMVNSAGVTKWIKEQKEIRR